VTWCSAIRTRSSRSSAQTRTTPSSPAEARREPSVDAGHLSLITRPNKVVSVIETAADATT
jgi:hypothetical protein